MTAKDYELLAQTISETRDTRTGSTTAGTNALDLLTLSLASKLAADNPRFDGERFARACGMGVAQVKV